VELGLADRLGDIRAVLRERFGDKVVTPVIAERGWFSRKIPGIGTDFESLLARPGLTDELISTLEARAIWARYGF
jgi:hypothetical protein